MKIILHIGSEKTGSTSVQAALNQQRDSLRAQGIFVPDWSNKNLGCHSIVPLFRGELCKHVIIFQAQPVPFKTMLTVLWQEWDQIEAQVRAEKPDVLVLTSETLFRPLEPVADAFITRLKALSDDIEVVCYLRDPYGYAVSWAGQVFKQQRRVETARLTEQMAYVEVLDSFSARFDGAVRVLEFGAPRPNGGSSVEAFFEDVLGVSAAPQSKPLFWNVTPSPEGLAILQDYDIALHRTEQWRHVESDFRTFAAVLRLENELGFDCKQITLTPVAKAWIHRASPDLDLLKAQYGVSLTAKGDLSPVDPELHIPDRLELRDVFVLDPDRMAALKARIATEMPAFHASSGSSLRARLLRQKIKLRRKWRS